MGIGYDASSKSHLVALSTRGALIGAVTDEAPKIDHRPFTSRPAQP
jgi:hypothetical protein